MNALWRKGVFSPRWCVPTPEVRRVALIAAVAQWLGKEEVLHFLERSQLMGRQESGLQVIVTVVTQVGEEVSYAMR